MNYYKNLIKRKKYTPLKIGFIFFLIGLALVIICIMDISKKGIAWKEYRFYNDGLMDFIGTSNIGMLLIAFLNIYFGLFFIPIINPYAQDDSEFEVKNEGDYIRIFFRKYEFLVKKDEFYVTGLFWRDENNRFITMLRGIQIKNYVGMYYKDLIEKKVVDSKKITKSEVVSKFSNVRVCTKEEKENYFTAYKLKDKPKKFFIIVSIFVWYLFALTILAVIVNIIDLKIFEVISAIILAIIFYGLGKMSNNAINRDRRLIKRIKDEDMYIVECKIFDRIIFGGEDTRYLVKITDGNYIVDQWINIPRKRYEQDDTKIYFYVFDKTGRDIFKIV